MSNDFNPDTDEVLNPENKKIPNVGAFVRRIFVYPYGGQQNIKSDMRTKQEAVVLQLDLAMSDQARDFLETWMPGMEPVYDSIGNIIQNHPPEVIVKFKGPKVFGACRVAVMLPDKLFNGGPYVFVMSVGIERMILRYYKDGEKINFDVQGALADSEADNVSDPDDMTIDRVT